MQDKLGIQGDTTMAEKGESIGDTNDPDRRDTG